MLTPGRDYGEDVSVIIPFRGTHPSRVANLDFVRPYLRTVLPLAEHIICDDNDWPYFNRGRAIIQARKLVPRPYMLFWDADLLLPMKNILEAIQACRDELGSFVVPFTSLAFLNEPRDRQVRSGADPFQAWKKSDVQFFWETKSVGTANVVSAENYDMIGGFEPRHRSWGYDDSSFDTCCQTLIGHAYWVEGRGTHLFHPTARRPECPMFKTSTKLAHRYDAARGDEKAVLALIKERETFTL